MSNAFAARTRSKYSRRNTIWPPAARSITSSPPNSPASAAGDQARVSEFYGPQRTSGAGQGSRVRYRRAGGSKPGLGGAFCGRSPCSFESGHDRSKGGV